MKQTGLSKTLNINLSENLYESPDFFKGIFSLYIHKKTRRLAEALYLVTKHLNDDEPIKRNIRNESTKLIELSIKIRNERYTRHNTVLYEETVGSIAKLISFLEVSVIAGIINESNHYIINKELNLMFLSLKDRLTSLSDRKGEVDSSFFDIEIKDTSIKDKYVKDKVIKNKDYYKIDDQNSIKDMDKKTLNINVKTVNLDSPKDIELIKDRNKSKKILRTVKKIDREKIVTSLFKDNKKMNIKNLSLLLPQFSEKTIQRVVHALVSKELLSKTGEKRWSLYFLPNS